MTAVFFNIKRKKYFKGKKVELDSDLRIMIKEQNQIDKKLRSVREVFLGQELRRLEEIGWL